MLSQKKNYESAMYNLVNKKNIRLNLKLIIFFKNVLNVSDQSDIFENSVS